MLSTESKPGFARPIKSREQTQKIWANKVWLKRRTRQGAETGTATSSGTKKCPRWLGESLPSLASHCTIWYNPLATNTPSSCFLSMPLVTGYVTCSQTLATLWALLFSTLLHPSTLTLSTPLTLDRREKRTEGKGMSLFLDFLMIRGVLGANLVFDVRISNFFSLFLLCPYYLTSNNEQQPTIFQHQLTTFHHPTNNLPFSPTFT